MKVNTFCRSVSKQTRFCLLMKHLFLNHLKLRSVEHCTLHPPGGLVVDAASLSGCFHANGLSNTDGSDDSQRGQRVQLGLMLVLASYLLQIFILLHELWCLQTDYWGYRARQHTCAHCVDSLLCVSVLMEVSEQQWRPKLVWCCEETQRWYK